MENGSLTAGFYAEPPLSPAPNGASVLSVAPTPVHAPELAPPASASEPEQDKTPSLERLLLKFGLLTPAQLTDAMSAEHETGRPLWEIVVERDWVSRDDLARLAEHTAGGQPVASEPRPVASAPSAPEPEPVSVPVAAAPPAPEPHVYEVPAPAPVAPAPASQPEPAHQLASVPEPPAAAAPEPEPEAEASTQETAFRVVVCLANGERIEAHLCNGARAARLHAEELVRGFAAELDTWPYFSGRFVRPESIISIDVEAAL
jgi:hypothetical protein